ncbi:MAG TPA: zinc ribbon domain-containing protein [Gemmataceae bacterium]|nr:zinc ribbon domain-containing protein [Gemmataceae bacterium]
MANVPSTQPCPNCGERVSSRASVCPFCNANLYDDGDDAPETRRRPMKRSGDINAVEFIVPTNVSGASILSCYLGLIGFCLPLLGLLFAIPAVIFGIIALRRRRQATSYGAVTSDVRAIIGLVLGGLGTLHGLALVVLLLIGLLAQK